MGYKVSGVESRFAENTAVWDRMEKSFIFSKKMLTILGTSYIICLASRKRNLGSKYSDRGVAQFG